MSFLSISAVLACGYIFLNLKTQIGISNTSLQSSPFLPIHNLNPLLYNVSNYDLD